MLKKFNAWLAIENNQYIEEQNNDLLLEAIQGNVTKETIPHLFSDDTIKYLYQFDPDDHAEAEYQRYQILFEAMRKRQEYYKEFFSEYEKEEKENLIKIFEKQKSDLGILNSYFSKDLEETIINHCARKSAYEKINKEKLDEWWNSDSNDGGKQFLKDDFEVSLDKGRKKYKVNLFLKDMVARIEKNPNASSGADLSFPQERHEIDSKSGKYQTVKRFSGMLLPKLPTMKASMEKWKLAVANNMLSTENPKHDQDYNIVHLKSLFGEGGVREKIKYEDIGKENMELFDIEKTILNKELRKILYDQRWNYQVKKTFDAIQKETDADTKKNLIEDLKSNYNLFIKDFIKIFPFALKIYNEIPSAFKDEKSFEDYKPLNNTQAFFSKIASHIKEDLENYPFVAYRIFESEKEEDKKEKAKKRIKYDDIFEILKDDKASSEKYGNFAELLKSTPKMSSFLNLMSTIQIIDWVKEGNIKSVNPITGETIDAKILEKDLKIPNVYMPTFNRTISFENKKGEEVSKSVSMPLLLPGKVLKEKSRQELSGEESESDTGVGMWSPYHKEFKKRYFDRTFDRFAGIQGQEDKLKGGLRPNQNIESFDFMCPSSDEKAYDPNSFWNRVKKIVKENGGLATITIEKSKDLSKLFDASVPREEKKQYMPKLVAHPIKTGGSKENVVVLDIAKNIWDNLMKYSLVDGKAIKPEKILAANYFMSIYNLIFSKVLQNLGDILMTDKEALEDFITKKIQIFFQKNIIEERGARATKEEGKFKIGTSKSKFEDPTEILEKPYATGSIDKYVAALEAHALHLCRKDEDILACGKCKNPIDGKCGIFMNGEDYHADAKLIISMFKEYERTIEKSASKIEPKSKPLFRTTPAPKPISAPISAPVSAPEPESVIIKHLLPAEQEHVFDIQTKIIDKLTRRLLSKKENERLKIAQQRYEKMQKIYFSNDPNIDELMDSVDKEFEELTKKVDEDYIHFHTVLNEGLKHYKSFESFLIQLCKTNNWDDILKGIQ